MIINFTTEQKTDLIVYLRNFDSESTHIQAIIKSLETDVEDIEFTPMQSIILFEAVLHAPWDGGSVEVLADYLATYYFYDEVIGASEEVYRLAKIMDQNPIYRQ